MRQRSLWAIGRLCLVFALGVGLAANGQTAAAADRSNLAVVRPVTSCENLAQVDLAKAADAPLTFSAAIIQTPKGAFCKVSGQMDTGNSFEINLPVDRWTQRYAQSAQGNIAINNAGSCMPATNGEMVVGVNGRTQSRKRPDWQRDPRQRIAFAYLLNHQTVLIAKALILAYYGQPQKYAYFTGCSGGGREVLIEAQRFPQDFDGVAVGAPNTLLSIHNAGFFHGWEAHVNRRADGSLILTRGRLALLHKAVIQHCAAVSGLMDGVLQMPSACRFDPAWVRCAAGATDKTGCLDAKETAVAEKLYRGATDARGRSFDTTGYPLGSEMLWPLGIHAGGAGDAVGEELRYLLPIAQAAAPSAQIGAAFRFDQAWFDRAVTLAPLYNGSDTNLRPFAAHGGKVLLWQGGADPVVQQESTIAYYQGVQKAMGAKATDAFMRFFLLPGVAHCGGGEGPAQIDVLAPLMAWVELGRQPRMLVAGKPEDQRSAIPAEGAEHPVVPRYPYAPQAEPAITQRPVFPFPAIARYTGRGDRNDPANYVPMRSSVAVPQRINSRAMAFYGPDNHAFYHIEDGELAADR